MRPLEGVKVLDFTQAHAGSLATMLLADFGAEVIKIERAGVGDLARYWEPLKNGKSGYYSFLNRNKKSIGLNAFTDKGKEIIYKLVGEVDVVCENFKYGSMQRMGFDYETLKAINPGIIYASLNGFGQTGIMKNTIGLDLQLQAMSGVMDRTGFPDGPPTKVGAAFGDHLSGTYMAMAINLALINKKKTGLGQKIDIAILDCLCSVLEENPVAVSLLGNVGVRSGNSYPSMVPYDTYKTKDGYITVAASTEKQWKLFCEALGFEDIGNNPEYQSNDLRVKSYPAELKGVIESKMSSMSKYYIENKLSEAGVPCGIVCSVSETAENPQILDRKMLVEVDDKEVGKVAFPGTVIKLDRTPGKIEDTAPRLGQDTNYYLEALGYSTIEVDQLVAEGVLERTEDVGR